MPIADLPQEVISKLNVLNLERLKEFNFAVQIDGDIPGSQLVMGFHEVGGLSDGVRIREVQEGGYRGIHRFPRNSKLNAITLRRGMTFSRFLYNWFQSVARWTKGKPDYRRTISIYMLDRVNVSGTDIPYEVWRWDIYDAWPSDWNGPVLDSLSERIAFESVTIQHTGISEASGIFSGKAGEYLSILN